MIRSGRASLVVLSTETDPSTVSEVLALTPTTVELKGTVLRSGRVREHHVWSLDVGTLDNDDDLTGTRALRELLVRARPAFGRVGALPTDCDVRVWWSADSDSTQGGFVLPIDLVGQISALGADVYATVYLDDDAAGDGGDPPA
ncbi:DUF4279 domain-containing protein [Microbacterium sp. LjRoot45]|uniref:DUF4279 domain-containing protein n=1 Tax=Microbacterium sp. LjRoot45 TaxID=3342329 RepID=UPI003ED01780